MVVQQQQQVVDLFFVVDVNILELVVVLQELVVIVIEMVQYLEINMEVFFLDVVVVDVGKMQEENIVVENSEFGNFFMVNMLIVIEILVFFFD